MNKTSKKIWLHYIFAPALLILLLFLIYKQLTARGDLLAQWQRLRTHLSADRLYWFIPVLLLAPLNWSLEALKWQQLQRRIRPMPYGRAFLSMLTGMAFSLVTPNRVGDFAGRIMHVAEGYKLKAALASMIGSIAQMCITASFGLIGLVYYHVHYGNQVSLIALVMASLLLLLIIFLYMNLGRLLSWGGRKRNRKLRQLHIALRVLKAYDRKDLLYILLLALGRFLIYNIQFLLLINMLGAEVPWGAGFLMSGLMFWTLAVVPSVAMLELGVRGYTGILLFVQTGLTPESLPVLTGSYLLWVINMVLPAIFGSFAILAIRKK